MPSKHYSPHIKHKIKWQIKVVVAFSGGLDTSYTVMKLTQDGWDVYAACANTGGFSTEQLKTNEENAYKLGAKAYVTSTLPMSITRNL